MWSIVWLEWINEKRCASCWPFSHICIYMYMIIWWWNSAGIAIYWFLSWRILVMFLFFLRPENRATVPGEDETKHMSSRRVQTAPSQPRYYFTIKLVILYCINLTLNIYVYIGEHPDRHFNLPIQTWSHNCNFNFTYLTGLKTTTSSSEHVAT